MGRTAEVAVARFTEDELVDEIRRILSGPGPGVLEGIGDDAAVVEVGDGRLILTVDTMVEGVDFALGAASPRDVGFKALTASVSDVAAMGGSPRFGLIALGLSSDTDPAWVVEFYAGVRDAAIRYGVSVVGGDLSRADRTFAATTLVGDVGEGAEAVLRSGARPGDRIVVTGSLGAAAGGLRLLGVDPHAAAKAAGSAWGRALLDAQLRPAARVNEGLALARAGATAMMDVSDGLTLDLSRLCAAGGVCGAIDLARVPVHPALRHLRRVLPVEPLAMALGGGEDFELLATLPPAAVGSVGQQLRSRIGTALTDIGEIRSGSGLVAVEADGAERPLRPSGWDHFAS